MDQLFERLGDLFKSWMTPDEDDKSFADPGARAFRNTASTGHTGNSFYDEAMEELDAFLRNDRQQQHRDGQTRMDDSQFSRKPSVPPPKLVVAYGILGLKFGDSFDTVRKAYKRLLKEHHPDRHGATPERQKRATETSARINDAYRIIETWHETGTIGNE